MAKRTMKLTVTVTYEHCESDETPTEDRCRDQLVGAIQKIANDGELSGWEDDLVVDDWTYHTETVGLSD